MPEHTECLADDGRIHVLKMRRSGRRHLLVDVDDPDGRRVGSVSLPMDVDRTTIEGLDPQSIYRVRVRRARLWERCRHPDRWFTVRPQTHDLRVLITGTGRSGTQTLAHYLDGQQFTDGTLAHARHQPLDDWMLDAFLAKDTDFVKLEQRGALHNVESAPYYSIYPDVVCAEKTIMVIRDGRKVVQSGLNRGWYTREIRWDHIKPDYGLGQFESSCRLWADCNANAAALADRTFRLEDLVRGGESLREFNEAVGLVAGDRQLPHCNRGRAAVSVLPWTEDQNRTFDEICGDLMDRHYAGWRG